MFPTRAAHLNISRNRILAEVGVELSLIFAKLFNQDLQRLSFHCRQKFDLPTPLSVVVFFRLQQNDGSLS